MINVARVLLSLALTSLCLAGEPSDVAIAAQRAWRNGDGDAVLALAHPTLSERVHVDMQLMFIER